MDQIITEQLSSISEEETQPEFIGDNVPAAFLPPIILPEIYREKSGKVLYPRYTQETKALQWTLKRLAGWDLPGKEHVEEGYNRVIIGTVVNAQ